METFLHYGSVALAAYKAFAIVIIVLSIMGIMYVAKKSGEVQRKSREAAVHSENPEDVLGVARASTFVLTQLKDSTIQHWHRMIEKLGNQQGEKDYKAAIIEADALVDAALRANGFPGETMGDRLRAIPVGRLSLMEDIWKAHRVRNEIAHDPQYVVSPREGHDMMRIYKKALEELGAL